MCSMTGSFWDPVLTRLESWLSSTSMIQPLFFHHQGEKACLLAPPHDRQPLGMPVLQGAFGLRPGSVLFTAKTVCIPAAPLAAQEPFVQVWWRSPCSSNRGSQVRAAKKHPATPCRFLALALSQFGELLPRLPVPAERHGLFLAQISISFDLYLTFKEQNIKGFLNKL